MRVAPSRYASLGSRLVGNDIREGADKFAMLCSAPSESSARDVSTRAEQLCVVTTHNRDQEV